MRSVRREEILDYVTYEEQRAEFQARVLPEKRLRRVHVGGVLTFLFENADTIRYQIQEMMRVERIVRESDIQREIDTYNELIGGPGELGCTLLIELPDAAERQDKLTRWLGLPEHVYMVLEDGERTYATFDPRQVGEERLSSVQYLKFATAGRTPVALGCDHPDLAVETELTEDQRKALRRDLDD